MQGAGVGGTAPDKQPNQPAKRQPKREALPAHLPRVDQRVEPENTNCPTPECGQPMVRVGEDISERLDIISVQFPVLAPKRQAFRRANSKVIFSSLA